MFYLTFDPTQDINKVYEISTILSSVVKIVPIVKPKKIPQCTKCQGFGHTKNYCCKPARCVKCAGRHTTDSCVKPVEIPPKCVNCGESHPANYRGCIVPKELQKIRNASVRLKREEQNSQEQNQNRRPGSNFQTNRNQVPVQRQQQYQQQQEPPRQICHQPQHQNNTQNPIPKAPTYAAASSSMISNPLEIQTSLQQILRMLKDQEIFNRTIEMRLENLEQSRNTHV